MVEPEYIVVKTGYNPETDEKVFLTHFTGEGYPVFGTYGDHMTYPDMDSAILAARMVGLDKYSGPPLDVYSVENKPFFDKVW